MIDWAVYPNFSEEEFKCSATSLCRMEPDFLDALQTLRTNFGQPLRITSGYRDAAHPIEQAKKYPGVHSFGIAADMAVSHGKAYDLLSLAMAMKVFTGIGIKQSGAFTQRFIHLDTATYENFRPDIVRPTVWSY